MLPVFQKNVFGYAWWMNDFSLPAVGLFVFCLLLVGCDRVSNQPAVTDQVAPVNSGANHSGVVTLQIDLGNTVRRIMVNDVADGTTLESVMRSIDSLDVKITGSGTTAFVHQINGRSASGSQGWTFTVDGQRASKGAGTTKLHPPTTVKWQVSG